MFSNSLKMIEIVRKSRFYEKFYVKNKIITLETFLFLLCELNGFKVEICIFCTFLANTLQIIISRSSTIDLYSLIANTFARS